MADPDAPARRTLRRYRAFATILLVVMAALTLATYAMPRGAIHFQDKTISLAYWVDLLQASAKAGLVGGLADWFAVTALFRHPLGIPIPHTAIIPTEKARLGQALGRFVSRHVMNPDEVTRVLARFDVGGFVKALLNDPAIAAPLARSLAAMMPRLLATIEDGRARRTLARLIPRLVGGEESGRVVARALRGLVEGGKHQEVLTFIIDSLRDGMLSREDQLRVFIEDRVRDQGGRLVGWALGASIATRILGTVNTELARMGPGGSELRDAFDEWARREITLMETDPVRAKEIGRAVRQVISNDTVQTWTWDVWARLRHALEADAARPNGRTSAVLDGAVRNLGELVARDEATRARLQRTAEKLAIGLLPAAQVQIAEFIAKVIAGWDTETIVDRLELRVGRDLQYVRMNGTLVGFLTGGALFALLTAVFGHVAF